MRCVMATRIMVINNSDDILGLFQKILASDDCQVFPQFFLNSDLREVRTIKPDLIILDYYVGREGVGWEFLQLLKMEDSIAAIPVLICTRAVKLAHEIAGGLATKQFTILRKPFESRDLISAVRDAGRKRDASNNASPGKRWNVFSVNAASLKNTTDVGSAKSSHPGRGFSSVANLAVWAATAVQMRRYGSES